jgi:hypothetical protein
MSLAVRPIVMAAFGLLLGLGLCACVADVGYGGGIRTGYMGDYYEPNYYEPYGYEYGTGVRNYRVGPPRGGEHRVDKPTTHAYHPAPLSRPTPSIPRHSRGH